jgi:hypothetical protein
MKKKKVPCPICERRKKLYKANICDVCQPPEGHFEKDCTHCQIENPCSSCGGKGFRDWVDEMRRPLTRLEISL